VPNEGRIIDGATENVSQSCSAACVGVAGEGQAAVPVLHYRALAVHDLVVVEDGVERGPWKSSNVGAV
jgi:hypothetical protein